MNIVLVDNRDSFTFNLVYDLQALGARVHVFRNNLPVDFLLQRTAEMRAAIVLSPGPGAPADAGVCVELVRRAAGRFSMLGICLGHQAIVEAFDGRVARANDAVHGRASEILVEKHALFDGLPRPSFAAARYHSLAAREIADELVSIAHLSDGTTMAVAHRRHRIAGLQFHPESILTRHGPRLLANALEWLHAVPAPAPEKEQYDATTA